MIYFFPRVCSFSACVYHISMCFAPSILQFIMCQKTWLHLDRGDGFQPSLPLDFSNHLTWLKNTGRAAAFPGWELVIFPLCASLGGLCLVKRDLFLYWINHIYFLIVMYTTVQKICLFSWHFNPQKENGEREWEGSSALNCLCPSGDLRQRLIFWAKMLAPLQSR